MPERYFECAFDHDKLPDGSLPPARQLAVTVARPVILDGQPGMGAERVIVKAIPGTRTFVTADPVVADALATVPTLRETDPPKQTKSKD